MLFVRQNLNLNFSSFIALRNIRWRSEKNAGIEYILTRSADCAVIAGDTLFVSQGGCTHFGFLVENRIASDTHSLADSAYWLNLSLQPVKTFGFDFYEKEIEAGNLRRRENSNNDVWYEFFDGDPQDNLCYRGIGILSEDKYKAISISQYYN